MLKTIQWWICFLQTCSFRLHKMLIDRLESFGLLCGLLWRVSLILMASIHCRGSIVEQVMWCKNCSDEETNSPTSWMAWGRVHSFSNFHFRLNYSFKLNNLLHNKQLKKTDRRVHLYPYVHVIIRKSTYILIN